MKYFIRKTSWSLRPDIDGVITDKDCEVTAQKAQQLYKDKAGPGFENLTAIPNFVHGKEITCSGFILWGEDITVKECFKRMLAGKLDEGIIE